MILSSWLIFKSMCAVRAVAAVPAVGRVQTKDVPSWTNLLANSCLEGLWSHLALGIEKLSASKSLVIISHDADCHSSNYGNIVLTLLYCRCLRYKGETIMICDGWSGNINPFQTVPVHCRIKRHDYFVFLLCAGG